jgi:hypothetical protein
MFTLWMATIAARSLTLALKEHTSDVMRDDAHDSA